MFGNHSKHNVMHKKIKKKNVITKKSSNCIDWSFAVFFITLGFFDSVENLVEFILDVLTFEVFGVVFKTLE